MAIDITAEPVYPLAEVPDQALLRRRGKKIHKSTPFRWVRHGAIAEDGVRIYLESIRCGGCLCTSTEALQRFFDRLSQRSGSPSPALPIQSAVSLRAAERANDALTAMGV